MSCRARWGVQRQMQVPCTFARGVRGIGTCGWADGRGTGDGGRLLLAYCCALCLFFFSPPEASPSCASSSSLSPSFFSVFPITAAPLAVGELDTRLRRQWSGGCLSLELCRSTLDSYIRLKLRPGEHARWIGKGGPESRTVSFHARIRPRPRTELETEGKILDILVWMAALGCSNNWISGARATVAGRGSAHVRTYLPMLAFSGTAGTLRQKTPWLQLDA